MRRALPPTLGFLLIFSIVLQLLLIYSAWFGAPIIQQVEAQIGHALTCLEAFQHREIDSFFYPDHQAQSYMLYMANLCAPFWLGLIALLMLGAGLLRRRLSRLHWLLVGVMLALLVPIIIYWPVIYKNACATE